MRYFGTFAAITIGTMATTGSGQSTGPDQTACSQTCSCSTCWDRVTCYGIDYSPDPVLVGPVLMELLPPRHNLPPLTSDRRPARLMLARRSGFERPGRTLRHRGAFRNFRKMH